MELAAGLLLALGGMASFTVVFSPLVLAKLPGETAGPFIRQVFPWSFLAVSILFGCALAPAFPGLAILAAIITLPMLSTCTASDPGHVPVSPFGARR